MTRRDVDLAVNVTASNRASDELRKVADDAKAIPDGIDIPLTADDQASDELARVDQAADDLDGRTATVSVDADDNASRTLADVTGDVRDLDGMTATATVRADVDEAKRLLDQVDAKLRELDGRRAGVSVTGAAAAGGAAGAVAGQGIPVVEDVVRGATSASDQVFQIEQLARSTGSTREEASRLARVWQDAGLDLQDLLDLMANLQQVIRDQPDLREKLNLSLANDGVETFLQTVQNLNTEIDNAGERTSLKSTLFGEEGQRQVERVLILVKDDLRGAMDDISQTRLINDESLESAREMNQHATELRNKWEQIQSFVLRAFTQPVGPSDAQIANAFGIPLLPANPGLSEEQITNRNLGFGPLGNPAAPPSTRQGPLIVNINPPGTPSTTVQQQATHLARNGVRLS